MSRWTLAWTVACLVAGLSPVAGQSTNTAEIAGVVVTSAEPRAPIARALVTISGDTLKPSRTTISDDQGRFAFAGLPSGTFTVTASRAPFVKTMFGAKRPGRPGTPIVTAAGQRVGNITIPLARGAAITGVIRGVTGEPAPGVTIDVMPLDVQAAMTTPILTDDRGIYRAYGLPPGRYTVAARVSDFGIAALNQHTDAEMDVILARLERRGTGVAGRVEPPATPAPAPPAASYGFAPIYYPGTPQTDQATTLTVVEGEERAGIDIALQLVRLASIEGRVSGVAGVPAGTQVSLQQLGLSKNVGRLTASSASAQADAIGAFKFSSVVPGRYRLSARTTTTPSGVLWALSDLTIGDADVSGVDLMLRPGLTVSGHVAFDARSKPPPAPDTVRLNLVDVTGASTVPPRTVFRPDGTFEVTGLTSGTYELTSSLAGWVLKSAVLDGRDLLDLPLDLGPSGDVAGVVVTFGERLGQITGTLQASANTPASEYFVVVLPVDRAFWRPGARRIRSVRPATDGRFTLSDLPAGEYVLAALTDVEPTDLFDASFLEQLVPSGVRLQLADGESRTQDLRIVK